MNSSLNLSYGPQSNPCVSTEVTIRKSPAADQQRKYPSVIKRTNRASTLLESVVVNTRLVPLQQRIRQLETLADELVPLVEGYYRDDNSGDADLGRKGQQWYRGCRELLVQNKLSSLAEFEECYRSSSDDDYYNLEPVLSAKSRRNIGMTLAQFGEGFRKARSLVCASEDELLSRELAIITRLSFAVAENEFDSAESLVKENRSNEVMIRAGGVIGRVALERHLWTVADSRALTVVKNPPTKKVADVSDLLATLVKETVLTQIQRSQLDGLFAIANNCAHPKEAVRIEDVERLIRDGRVLASTVL